jgi:hypothetical protein
MITKNSGIRARLETGSMRLVCGAVLMGLPACLPAAKAQSVLPFPPGYEAAQTSLRQIPIGGTGLVSTNALVPGITESSPFRCGPVTLRPSIWYQFLAADGIQSRPGRQVDTIIQTVTPGLLFDIGQHWSLNYSPSWTFYSSREFKDTLNHAASLVGRTSYEDWNLGLSQFYTKTSNPQLETGTQAEQENHVTRLDASYAFNSKLSLDMQLNQIFSMAESSTSFRQWSTMEWLNYQFWPRFTAALGAGGGYVDVDTGFNSTFEQVQGRINWLITDKTSVSVHGGFEERQFLDSGADSLLNPVFGASLQYQPFEFTRLSLDADREVSSSAFRNNEVTESTSITAALNQRLLEKLSLSLSGSYYTTRYVSATTATSTGRTDDYYAFNVRLSCPFLKRGTIAVIYQFMDNSSSETAFTYSSSQIGFEVGYRY